MIESKNPLSTYGVKSSGEPSSDCIPSAKIIALPELSYPTSYTYTCP